MVSLAAMFNPYFKSFEGSDYCNKPVDLPFQSWNVIEFSSPLLLAPLAFYIAFIYLNLVSDVSF